MLNECFFAVLDIHYEEYADGYHVIVTTDVPCHLYMRWSTTKPQYHTVPVLRRGIYMHGDRYVCFVAYVDNEQVEPGDTLVHTFIKRPWPSCQTRWFYFWGMISGQVCRSTSAVFEKHFGVAEAYDYLPCWHNRHLYSTHGTWATARNGFNLLKDGWYQRPSNILRVWTGLNASYNIVRAYQSFDSWDLPADKIVKSGQLGLYVTLKRGINGLIYITKGLWDEPVVDTDWALQTNETTILGSINLDDIVVGAYNWIDLNPPGLAYINQRSLENIQQESYDWHKNCFWTIYHDIRISQSFTPIRDHKIHTLKLRLKKIGATRTLFIDIFEAGPDHCPTGDLLAQCWTDSTFVSTDPWGDWFYARLDKLLPLQAAKEYCVVVWCKPADANNCVQWIGASNSQYPNGLVCASTDSGYSWTPYPTYDNYFIEYECETWDEAQGSCAQLVGGTKFCLRTAFDVSDVPPGATVNHEIQFYSAQKGAGFYPLLRLYMGEP